MSFDPFSIDSIFQKEPKPAFGPERLDWISDDETQKRFDRANGAVKKIVVTEELRHKDHADTVKPFRVDVIRDPSTMIVYLDMTCEACGEYRKFRVDERTGDSEMIATTLTGAPKPYAAADALAAAAKIEAERKQRERDAREAIRRLDEEKRRQENRELERKVLRDLQRQVADRNLMFTAPPLRQFWASAMPMDPRYYDDTDRRPLDAKPLRGKPVHKDKLGIERAPIDEEEV